MLSVKFQEMCEVKKDMNWTQGLYKYVKIPFLIISEFGVKKLTESQKEVFEYIIDERYKMLKPFLITTNLSVDDFKTEIDILPYNRVYDRLTEICELVVMDWELYRQRKKEK